MMADLSAKGSAAASRFIGIVGHPLQSLTTRKYLLGTVIGWVLVVYLVASPTPSAAPASPAGAGGASPSAVSAGSPSAPLAAFAAPSQTAPTFPAPSFSAPTLGFTAPLDCPYPVPQSQSTPFSAGIFLDFEGPFVDLAGPFSSYFIPTLGAIAPLVPLATPLVYISEPVLNALTPNLSNVVTDYLTVIDDAGLDSPEEQQFADDFEPYYLDLLNSLSPVETELASSTPGQCLVLFENELAVMDSQEDITLPNPPLVVPDISQGSSSEGASAVASAASASPSSSFAQLTLPSSGGVPSSLASTEAALRSKGHPVELELVDDPPAGQSTGGTAFSDFVAEAVHASPQVSAFQIDAPADDPAGASEMADLVHGLAAADMERLPGQTIGVGVPQSATGAAATAFWGAFDQAMQGYQSNMVDFVAADLTPQSESTPAAAQAEAASSAKSLEAAFHTLGGVPADVPVFGTVTLAGAGPWSNGSVLEQIDGYLGALRPLRVSVLGVDTGG